MAKQKMFEMSLYITGHTRGILENLRHIQGIHLLFQHFLLEALYISFHEEEGLF